MIKYKLISISDGQLSFQETTSQRKLCGLFPRSRNCISLRQEQCVFLSIFFSLQMVTTVQTTCTIKCRLLDRISGRRCSGGGATLSSVIASLRLPLLIGTEAAPGECLKGTRNLNEAVAKVHLGIVWLFCVGKWTEACNRYTDIKLSYIVDRGLKAELVLMHCPVNQINTRSLQAISPALQVRR